MAAFRVYCVNRWKQERSRGSSLPLPRRFPENPEALVNAPMPIVNLDAKTVARLVELPEGKEDEIYFDSDLAGFGLRLRSTSRGRVRRTWIAQYRAHGRTRRMKIGAADKITVDQARKAAKEVLAKVTLGQDPQGEKAVERLKATRTLRSVANDFLEAQKPVLRPSSFRVTKLYLTGSYFRPLHTSAITAITHADVAARIGAITRAHSSVTAASARSALSTLFKWAMGEGLLGAHPINPVIGTNKPKDAEPRDRVLTEAELAAIWHGCQDDDFGKIVKLLMLTACRREEIGGLRWSEIDLENGLLKLPAARVKNKHAHRLPLMPLALSIIGTVHQRDGRDHLFGERSRTAGFTGWARAKADLDERLGGKVVGWRLHDSRRSAATMMGDLGVEPHIIEAVLNHYSGHRSGVSGVYNRAKYERQVRAAMALWNDHVRAITERSERKIVPFKGS